MRLNQVIALVTGKKAKAQKLLTGIHHGWREDRLTGIERTYHPMHEDGDQLPSESKKVQLRVRDELKKLRACLDNFYHLVATQEIANCQAQADIVLQGKKLIEKVPVGVLLFLEKQLVDLHTLASKIPTLDVDKTWTHDSNSGLSVTAAVETVKTQKTQEPLVLYHATPEHPAQTQIIAKDVPVGKWSTIHLSGSLAMDEKEAMMDRIERLLDAVKKAREEANTILVDVGEARAAVISATALGFIFDNRIESIQAES